MENRRRGCGDCAMFVRLVAIGSVLFSAYVRGAAGGGGSTVASDVPTADALPASARPAEGSEVVANAAELDPGGLSPDSSSGLAAAAAATAAATTGSAPRTGSLQESLAVSGDNSERELLATAGTSNLSGGGQGTATRLSAELDGAPTVPADDGAPTVPADDGAPTVPADDGTGSNESLASASSTTMGAAGSFAGTRPFLDLHSPEPSTIPSNDATLASFDKTETGPPSRSGGSGGGGGVTHSQTREYELTLLDHTRATPEDDGEAAGTQPYLTATVYVSMFTATRTDLSPTSARRNTQTTTYNQGLTGSSEFNEQFETATRLATFKLSRTDLPELSNTNDETITPLQHTQSTLVANSYATAGYGHDTVSAQSQSSQRQTGDSELLSSLASRQESPTYAEAHLSYQYDITTAGQSMVNGETTLKDELLATEWSSPGSSNASPAAFTSEQSGLDTVVPEEAATNVASAGYSDVTAGSLSHSESVASETENEATTVGSQAEVSTWSHLPTPSNTGTAFDDVRTSADNSDVTAGSLSHSDSVTSKTENEATTVGSLAEVSTWSHLPTPSNTGTVFDDVRTSADYSDVTAGSLSHSDSVTSETENEATTVGSQAEVSTWSHLPTPSNTGTAFDDVRTSTAEEQSVTISTVSDYPEQSNNTQSGYGHDSLAPHTDNLSTLEASTSTDTLTESPTPFLENTAALSPSNTTSPGPSTNDAIAIEDRRNNSVIVKLLMTLEMYTEPFDKKYRTTIADAANEYCNSGSCQGNGSGSRVRRAAQAATTTTSASTGSSGNAVVFTAADVGVLPGYPKDNNGSGIDIATYLSSAVPLGSVASGVCISGEVLLALIIRSQANISTHLGVTVLTAFILVQPNATATPEILAVTAQRPSTSDGSTQWMVITAALVTLIVLVVFVLAVVIAVKKCKRRGTASVTPSNTMLKDTAGEQVASTSVSSAELWYANMPEAKPYSIKSRRLSDLEGSSRDLWYAEPVPKELAIGRRRVYHVESDDLRPVQQRPPEDTAYFQRTSPPPSYSVLPPIR